MTGIFVAEGDGVADVAPRVFNGLLGLGREQSIKRENLESKAWALTPAYYSFEATKARGDFEKWRQYRLAAAAEVLSEWHGLNPSLGHFYFPKYHDFVKEEAGRETYTYGERLRLDHQLGNAAAALRANPGSRQAVAVIFMPEDTHLDAWHRPCTLSYQFTEARETTDLGSVGGRELRGLKLDMRVSMRSQDFARGMKYDVLFASFVLQAVALDAGFRPGRVGFFVGNLHIYEADRRELKFTDFVDVRDERPWDVTVPVHDSGDESDVYTRARLDDEMERLRAYEFALRQPEPPSGPWQFSSSLLQEWADAFRKKWADARKPVGGP